MSIQRSADGRFSPTFDRLVIEACNSDEMPPDSATFDSCGVDSLQILSLIMSLEDELAVPWPIESLTSVGSYSTIGQLRAVARAIFYASAH